MVVAVYKIDEVACGFLKSDITSGGLTLIFLGDDDDASVFFGEPIDDFWGVVGGTVVNEDDFKILIGLIGDGR